jgi:hypothetical protein
MKTFCLDRRKELDDGIYMLLFAVRALFSLRKWSHTVNNDPTERLFKSEYGPEWSCTNVLIRFPHNSADVTRPTVLGYVSSYIRPVQMGHYPVGGFANTQVFIYWRIMGHAHNCFPVFFLYHYLADHFTFILHSRIWRSPFYYQYLIRKYMLTIHPFLYSHST